MNSMDISVEHERRSYFTALLLIFTVLGPMVGAYLIYSTGSGIPEATVNKGDLLFPPVNVSHLPIDNSGTVQTLLPGEAQEKRKWRLVIPVSSSCDEACMGNLYTTQQVQKRLGKDANRLERILVLLEHGKTTENNLNTESDASVVDQLSLPQHYFNNLQIGSTELNEWQRYFSDTSALNSFQNDSVILVDQEGFAMMSYAKGFQGNDLLDDLKRLLRYSYE